MPQIGAWPRPVALQGSKTGAKIPPQTIIAMPSELFCCRYGFKRLSFRAKSLVLFSRSEAERREVGATVAHQPNACPSTFAPRFLRQI